MLTLWNLLNLFVNLFFIINNKVCIFNAKWRKLGNLIINWCSWFFPSRYLNVCVQEGRRGPAACCSTTSQWALRTPSSCAWRQETTRRCPPYGWLRCTRFDRKHVQQHQILLTLRQQWGNQNSSVFWLPGGQTAVWSSGSVTCSGRHRGPPPPGSTHPSVRTPSRRGLVSHQFCSSRLIPSRFLILSSSYHGHFSRGEMLTHISNQYLVLLFTSQLIVLLSAFVISDWSLILLGPIMVQHKASAGNTS